MAKATLVKAKPVKQPPNKIILELTEGEADLIYFLMSRITGSMNSPRKYSNRIYNALAPVLRIPSYYTDASKFFTGNNLYSQGGVVANFNDYPAHQR